ncbi:MAG: hypothetical protein HGA39_07150 [Coriobacteriia bacterium]|nr:hypothetical protein [Coriobacteriia bacterium]
MKRYDWLRLVLCGLVAGAVWNLSSAVLLAVLAPDFVPLMQGSAPYPAFGGEVFYVVDLTMGIWAVWLFSAITPRYGAGPVTAAIVGVAWWLLATLQSVKWVALGFAELGADVLLLGALTLGAAILASAAGAWLYRRASKPSPQRPSAT